MACLAPASARCRRGCRRLRGCAGSPRAARRRLRRGGCACNRVRWRSGAAWDNLRARIRQPPCRVLQALPPLPAHEHADFRHHLRSADQAVQRRRRVRLRAMPRSTSLGLDSLALMEFVFAVEDRFLVRIPEDQLDPRQAGITLEHLADVLASSCGRRRRSATRRRPEAASAAPRASPRREIPACVSTRADARRRWRRAVRLRRHDRPRRRHRLAPAALRAARAGRRSSVDWRAGRIGSRECMAGQVALLDCSREELDAHVAGMRHRSRLRGASRDVVGRSGVPLTIVSDGLDHAIHSMLAPRTASEHLPVVASRLVQTGARRWALEFPTRARLRQRRARPANARWAERARVAAGRRCC